MRLGDGRSGAMATNMAVLAMVLLLAHVTSSSGRSRAFGPTSKHSAVLEDLVMNYRDPPHREARASSVCKEGTTYTGSCNLDCKCIGGSFKCCRLRKSYDNMTDVEKTRLTNAFLTASSHPKYKDMYASLVWSHSVFACAVVSTKWNLYHTELAFHRILVLAMENILRAVDCRVTLPYWDIGKNFEKGWIKQEPFTDGHFGSNGVGPDKCVRDGPFRRGNYKVPSFKFNGKVFPYPDCLRRNITAQTRPWSWLILQFLLTTEAKSSILVESGILESFDSDVHDGMAGAMTNVVLAVEPTFYLVHAYSDKLLVNYQARGPDFMTGNGLWNGTQPLVDFPWFRSIDFMDTQKMPNNVCLRWGASVSREHALKTGYYAGLELPRSDLLYVPYKKLRKLAYPSSRTGALDNFLGFFKATFKSFKFNKSGLHVSANWEKQMKGGTYLPLTADAVVPFCKLFITYDPQFYAYNVTSQLHHQILV